MNSSLDIPQFVIIHDQTLNAYKHPVIHYVFEQEEFPEVPKDKLIVVELDSTATQLTSVDSYSPDFQVTDCILEQSRLSSQFEKEESNLFNLTIEGVSVPVVHQTPSSQPIHSIDSLKETIFQFKDRNEMVKKVFKQPVSEQQQDNSMNISLH
ncbi:hypothetical protein BCV72DRAFT_307151 [Rhizopus microsporus var. microsporus]|uniref:Uncharacterized protein n=2 Tax=Rhizopus microsporus TaxID=58291 RepID=A0A2G4T390_RHIZD|nr:uncharacterized protein RHIMIDRAFT_234822 [Rhizopus microsporus ATCC 52813]ORE04613.1 hypothetical protein BCV72DRAFT_307151 [Rhizopus microsporus var. microsporus]PHZ15475.1 hypothetical protein RHIMIDRAFT_234822 [Rhizopus microsporus ATCC 52813]